MIKKKIALYTLLPSVKIAEQFWHYGMLIAVAFLLNILFLYFYNPEIYYTMIQLHGQLGYNFATKNELGVHAALSQEIELRHQEHDRLIDFDNIGVPEEEKIEPFPVQDPIGYGVLLGILWKITGSFKFKDVQLLQIIIFLVMMLLFYHAAAILFDSHHQALMASLLILSFLPITGMNIQPARDIWAFYGVVILFFLTVKLWKDRLSYVPIFCAGVFFAVCQWMRPTIFTALILFTVFNIPHFLMQHKKINTCLRAFCLLWCANILFFWIPFCAYNFSVHDRFFVGPCGQNLLEGLGEFENPWGYQLSDPWIAEYIFKKYGFEHGTAAFDDAADQEFWHAVGEQPLFYVKTLIKRIGQLILPPMQWLMLKKSPYHDARSMTEKICLLIFSPALWLDFLLRWVYIKVFLLLGYLGFFLMAYQKKWEELLLAVAIVVSGWSTFASHIECRYLIPFYWAFAIGISYLVVNRKLFAQHVYSFFDLME